jgi:soluble lytic murein transglycosylase-like protein
VEVAKKNKMNYILINGIIEKESLYNPFSVSNASAKGLMQILKEDGVDIDQDKVHDIHYNVETGVKILQSKMKKADGNISKGLSLYSGRANNYHNEIYENIGRYTMYREKELKEDITVSMIEK